MNRLALISAAALTTTVASVAEARTSSDAEYRGYTTCIAAADQQSNGLVPDRHYYVDKEREKVRYYINATRWEDGQRAPVAIACETKLRGAKLLDASITAGRFTDREPVVTVELAEN